MRSFQQKFLDIFKAWCHLNVLKLVDGRLTSEDGYTFPIHRITLATNSEYFRAMICDFDLEPRREFRIPGISGECLSEILCYIYTDDISLTERNITELLVASNYLQMNDLHRKIKKSVKDHTSISNCLRLYKALNNTHDDNIPQQCFRFIETHFEAVVRSQKTELGDLSLDNLLKILASTSLNVRDESTVWMAIVEWSQKDLSERLRCVPRLLMALAGHELDENLATEILQHHIVTSNAFLDDLNDLKPLKAFANNLDIILRFLRKRDSCNYRIPQHLHIITGYQEAGVVNHVAMYVTYDENLDVWRKICEIDFFPDVLIPVGSNIYTFDIYDKICRNFDLNTLQWVPMRNYRNDYQNPVIVEIDGNIYVLGEVRLDVDNSIYCSEVYDTSTDSWSDGVPLPNFSNGIAVTLSKRIYLVGYTQIRGGIMVANVFDVPTRTWSSLPAPNVDCYRFGLVAFNEKLYLIEGADERGELHGRVAVFDPSVNIWTEVAQLPHAYRWPEARVLNNQVIAYETSRNDGDTISNHVRWNDKKQSWEEMENTPLKDLDFYSFCTVEDVDIVRRMTRGSRDGESELEKSYFN